MKTKEIYLMAKRYTDTEIWKKQRWFKKLSPEYKCVFMYIKDQCNHAGIWNIDVLTLCEDVGLDSLNLMDFFQKCNEDFDKITGEPIAKERFKLLDNGKLWFTSFMRFQYEGKDLQINPAVAAVKSALEILSGYGVLEEAINKGYLTVKKDLDNPSKRVKDKDIDKDIDKEKDRILLQKSEEFKAVVRDTAALTPGVYTNKMLNQFFEYWSEPNKTRNRLKWEMEETWDTSRRLRRWLRSSDKKFEKTAPTQELFILGQKHNAAHS